MVLESEIEQESLTTSNKKEAIIISELNVDYHMFSRSRKKPFGEFVNFSALKNLNIEIFEGEIVALLGRNGAGKSTLLKCIAGLLRPSRGEIVSHGRIILLSGADPGFIPQLTGRQNVIELALAYGITKSELSDFIKSIEDFADIGEAFDRKFSGYSTVMR